MSKLLSDSRVVCILAMLFVPISAPSFSQSLCSNLEQDQERLNCYDKLYGKKPQASQSDIVTKWSSTSVKSKLNDKTNVFLTLKSNEVIDCGWNRGAKINLILRCTENTTSALLNTGCHMTSSRYNNSGVVTYRLDKNPAAKVTMEESTNNQTLGLWSGGRSIPFIKRMFEKQKLLVRATPFNENPFTATFDITGIEKEIAPLRKACGW